VNVIIEREVRQVSEEKEIKNGIDGGYIDLNQSIEARDSETLLDDFERLCKMEAFHTDSFKISKHWVKKEILKRMKRGEAGE
jgi:hypothetical protein